LNSILSKDTVLAGEVISMDTTSINIGQSKTGYLTYYGLFHIAVKLDDGTILQLVRYSVSWMSITYFGRNLNFKSIRAGFFMYTSTSPAVANYQG